MKKSGKINTLYLSRCVPHLQLGEVYLIFCLINYSFLNYNYTTSKLHPRISLLSSLPHTSKLPSS